MGITPCGFLTRPPHPLLAPPVPLHEQVGLSHLHQWLHGQAESSHDPAQVGPECRSHLGQASGPARQGSLCPGGLDVLGCPCHRGLRDHGRQSHERNMPRHGQDGTRHASVVERETHHWHECGAFPLAHHGGWRRCFDVLVASARARLSFFLPSQEPTCLGR